MSRGYPNGVTSCDRDCAGANHCHIGGKQCACCEMWFCPDCEDFDERGYCSACAEEYPADNEEGEEE